MTMFRLLLVLFPSRFRDAFGTEMREVFAAQLGAARTAGWRAVLGLWARTVTGMTAAAWHERRAARGKNGARAGRLPWYEVLAGDARLALRLLARTPMFAAIVVATVAVGVGGVTTVFSAVNAIVLRPLPGTADGTRLIQLERRTADGSEGVSASHAFYRYLAASTRSLDGVAAWSRVALTVSHAGQSRAVAGTIVSGNYFSVLGLQPAAGRFFSAADDGVPLASPVLVVSHEFWVSQLGSDPSIVGSEITVNGRPCRLIGVAPEGFHGVFTPLRIDAWVPLAMQPHVRPGRDLAGAPWLLTFGRLRAGVSAPQAHVELSTLADRWVTSADDAEPFRRYTNMRITPLTGLPDDARQALLGFAAVLLGASLLVLLIAGANVSALLAARAVSRRREMGVRVALGASRARLVRQLLTETIALFALGGLGGAAIAAAATGALERLTPPGDAALMLELSPDLRVLLFAITVAVLAGAVFGAGPALRGVGRNPGLLLKEDTTGAGRRHGIPRALVVAQVACSLVLLTVAGLFLRSIAAGSSLDPRFDPSGVAIARFNTESYGYDANKGDLFYDTLRRRLEASPYVERVSDASMVPLTFSDNGTTGLVDRGADGRPVKLPIRTASVGAGYFDVVRIPLLSGREFVAGDIAGTGGDVAIVNETFARRAWGSLDAIGRTFQMYSGRRVVIGVARDSRYASLTEGVVSFVYLPMGRTEHTRTLFVRARPGAPVPARLIETEVRAIDPLLPPPLVNSLAREIGGALFPQRVAAMVTGALGVLGLLLAAVGLYALVTHALGRRMREIGVRIALGAQATAVVRLMLADGVRLVTIGTVVGLAASLLATRLLAGYLVTVSPLDPAAFTGAALLLAAVTIAASAIPARRAARVSPIDVLSRDGA
jgi:predicted permease